MLMGPCKCRWLSACYMTMAQMGVVFPAAAEKTGWAWTGGWVERVDGPRNSWHVGFEIPVVIVQWPCVPGHLSGHNGWDSLGHISISSGVAFVKSGHVASCMGPMGHVRFCCGKSGGLQAPPCSVVISSMICHSKKCHTPRTSSCYRKQTRQCR